MLKNKLNQLRASEGFTIIEVIIVLVIAAIIMLMVFLVVPQLQRSQRNSRRQSDARRVLTAAEQYASNSGGVYAPTDTANPAPAGITAITGTLTAPSGTAYTFGTIGAPGVNNLQYTYNSYACSKSAAAATTSSGKVVVMVAQEGATSNTTWCVSN